MVIIFTAYRLFLNDTRFSIIALSILPSLMIICYQIYISENEVFSPLNFLFLNVLIGVTFQSIYLCFIDQGENRYGLYGLGNIDSYYQGILAIIISTVFLLIGYSFSLKSKFKKKLLIYRWNYIRIILISLLLLWISFYSIDKYLSIFSISLTDLTNISLKRVIVDEYATYSYGYLRFGAGLSQIVCITLFVYFLRYKDEHKTFLNFLIFLLILVSFIGGLILPFVSSQRSSIIYFLIALCAVSNFCYKKWSIHLVFVIFVVIMVILIVMGAMRYANGRTGAFEYYMENAGFKHIVSSIAGSANLLSISKTSILIENVPNTIQPQHGKTYGLWALAPIPRTIWNEKPIVRIGGELGPLIYATAKTGGTPPGYVGEAYLNFMWVGLPVVSILFGLMIGYFYENYGKYAYFDPKRALIYSSLYTTISFAAFSSDFTGLMARALQIILPILVILFVIKPRYRRKT